VAPFFQVTLPPPDNGTADAFSDPTVTFDAQGNAYIGGVLFKINSQQRPIRRSWLTVYSISDLRPPS